MIKYIIKRDGATESFNSHKVNQWSEWATEDLDIPWSNIVLKTIKNLSETTSSQELQLELIKTCLSTKKYKYNIMAGRLYTAYLRKKLYDNTIPTIYDLHVKMSNLKLLSILDNKNINIDNLYKSVEGIIEHNKDFTYPYSQIQHITSKYAVQNRTDKCIYETPQFVFIRMAIALSIKDHGDVDIDKLKELYNYFSNGKISNPTPNYVNLGTYNKSYASCCVIKADDNIPSLAIGDHIAYMMTANSAGIGSYIESRSLNDNVRKGIFVHQGKLPYYRALASAVKANLQGGRGGAATIYYNCYDPEVEDITVLQNPLTPKDKQNREVHFACQVNGFFIDKALKNEQVFTFNAYTAPDLLKSMFNEDQSTFTSLYVKYENDNTFLKKYISARKVLLQVLEEGLNNGTLYLFFTDNANMHTPFKETIYSSNLCTEIMEPTGGYSSMDDLYSCDDVSKMDVVVNDLGYTRTTTIPVMQVVNTDTGIKYAKDLVVGDALMLSYDRNGGVVKDIKNIYSPEVALCNLAAINVVSIKDDDEYFSVAVNCLEIIEHTINNTNYVLPHVGYTAKARLNAGVGIIGLAEYLAIKGLDYISSESLAEIHRVAERHIYWLIRASLHIAKDKGNAPWIQKTKWVHGWMPIDSYNKNVDEIVNCEYVYDWETLRKEVIVNRGIRNSVLVSHMPAESSSKATNTTNGVYPVRNLHLKKTDSKNVITWTAPNNEVLKYQLAWDVSVLDLIKVYAILQKFCDQGISADLYFNRSKNATVSKKDLLIQAYTMHKYGLKSRYYVNTLLEEYDNSILDTGCAGGTCTL